MIRILLVDDQKMIREALKIALESETDFQIVGTADNGYSAVNQVKELSPNVVLMNIEMPGIDGASATQTIANRFPDTKVLIFSSYDREEYIIKSLAVGAKGYLLKDASSQDIAAAIRSVNRGYTQISPGLVEKLLVQTDSGVVLSKLTSRSHFDNVPFSSEKKQLDSRSRNAIVRLQTLARHQSIKHDRLRERLNKIERTVPTIETKISGYSQRIWQIWLLLLSSIPVLVLILFSFYTRIENLEKNTIPIERVGLYGRLDLSGLAQRVVLAFEQDLELANVSDVYVAQSGSTVVLRGTISDLYLLDRMKDIASSVEGVTKVDTSAVEIR